MDAPALGKPTVLEIYLDESGTHDPRGAICVAGYAGTREQWARFEREWPAVLTKAGISHFHAKDNRCDPLRERLLDCIRRCGVEGLAVGINGATYTATATAQVKSVLGNAYAFCAVNCVTGFRHLLANEVATASFVFEAGQPNADYIERVIESAPDKEVRHGIRSVRFAQKSEFVPLQAADFLAHLITSTEPELLPEPERISLRGIATIGPEWIEIMNGQWGSAFGLRKRQKAEQKAEDRRTTQWNRQIVKIAQEHSRDGKRVDVVDGTLHRKYPNAAMYFVVQAKNGDLIVVPDTPEGWRDFYEISDGKWKRLL